MIQERVLSLNRSNRIHPILLIDEAQYLSNAILQELRLLTNFEIDSYTSGEKGTSGKKKKKRRKGHGRNGAKDYPGARKVEVKLREPEAGG